MSELFDKLKIMPEDYAKLYKYYKSGGLNNYANMFKWMANEFSDGCYEVCEPESPSWNGLYDPWLDTEDENAILEKAISGAKPVIGILIHAGLSHSKDLKHIDALMARIRELGSTPLCVYSGIVPDKNLGCEGIKASLERYMMRDGKPIVGAIINTTSFSLSVLSEPGDGSKAKEESIFSMLNVPVLQAMTTFQTYEKWKSSLTGIDGLSMSFCVFQPEFDGQIISVPFASTEIEEHPMGQKKVSTPITDRVDKVVRLAINWARLALMENSEKKIAVILHNNPPRNDTIGGAAGLDTPVSVYNIITELKNCGIKLDYDFADGKEIIDRIIVGLTNDGRWLPPEKMLERSTDTVNGDLYRQWYSGFGEKVRSKMAEDWGAPPGEFMVVEDNLLVPGILNGNIFIGLQPPRAQEEKAEELYHSTDMVVPHQYVGFYKWVERVFKADAIMHIGTHGTIEWLPGKEVGLSSECYSDLNIACIPHMYPYIISSPGEGTQAKRRTDAVLADYMVPSMVESGTYDELTEMDELMRQYYHIKRVDVKKLPIIQKQIWDLAIRMKLNDDIGISQEEADSDIDGCIERLHSWTSKIQACEIADGLHIFGKPPEGDRFRNMLKMLVRVRNAEVASLREGICDMLGLDFEELLAAPEKMTDDGKSNGILLAEVDDIGRRIFLELEKTDFEDTTISDIIGRFAVDSKNSTKRLKQCLNFVCTFVKPRVQGISDELDNLIGGTNGKFIPPGPSGQPTRGNARLLPTGRNFYSVDPGAMPSRSAWEVGKTLGKQLIERYIKDEGSCPESVAILVWATEAMRNYGDDIAEILYLLGVRPVWLGSSDRVVGAEVIPMEELGRPRIDVTLRITGLFRDAFPNLIERVEDAVNLVASLDEPHDINFVRKHVSEEVAELMEQGMEREQAFERSTMRIFGDPPGTYGAGVNQVVNSKKWQTVNDLGQVYTNWGSHVYGKKLHGEKVPEVFARRMTRTNVAVKNVSARESDMLDSDDFYNYFGGLVSAITTHSGKQKPAYIPCTADTDHIETLSIHEEASRVMRARINNPKWVEGMKRHGYKGAMEVSKMVDITFGWDATTDVIDDWMYDRIAERYAFDKDTADWMREVNPWALHNIAERLLEANQRGMWNASEENVERLKEIYLEMEGSIEDIL